MRKLSILFAVVIAATTACNNAPENTETPKTADTAMAEAPAPAPPPEVDSATAAKNYMEYMTPGEMHKMLSMATGKWATEMTMWEKEGAPPMTSKGESEMKMILGGRYKQTMFKGDMMGMPFEGTGLIGYDNAKKMFVETWADNMGTGIMTMEGTYDAATKTMSMTGKGIDPATGGECTMREVTRMVDDKTMMMEMYNTKGGKETKSFEMKMTKK